MTTPRFLRDLSEGYYVYSLEEDTLRRRINNSITTGGGYISPEPMYPERGEVSAPVELSYSTTKETPVFQGKDVSLLRLRNGTLQAFLNESSIDATLSGVSTGDAVAPGHHDSHGTADHTGAADRDQRCATQYMVIHPGYSVAVEAVLGRRHSESVPHPVPARGLANQPQHAYEHPARAASHAPYASHQDHCAICLASRAFHGAAIACQDIRYYKFRSRIEWLGNFKLVLLYNAIFMATVSLCLINKFIARVRRELYNRLVENVNTVAHCVSFLKN
ncbi:unnamed protein product [Leptidea sinapis]|uniref:Uncharacterized protein n=1 Tax=Leptidea sinapis TaxID=189913 RepID=A0A5E4QP68_9NEOP|nr:unnamed protein product [Leptidea sinapis]